MVIGIVSLYHYLIKLFFHMEKRSTISVIINGVFYVGSCIVTKSGINDDVIYCSVPGSTEMPKLVFLRDLPLPHCTAIILSAHQSVCVDEKYLALLISASECDVVEDVKVTVYGKGNRNRLQLLISFISRGTPYFALVDDAMSIAANPNLPYEERKALLSEVRKVIMPECPKGKRYSRNTFWQQFDERMILRWAIMGGTDEKIESCAKWLDENKKRGVCSGTHLNTSFSIIFGRLVYNGTNKSFVKWVCPYLCTIN